jgi:hypothetical protein
MTVLNYFSQCVRRYDVNSPIPYAQWSKYRMKIVDWVMDIEGIDAATKRDVSLQALRLILFDEMDLTHTCCQPDLPYIKPGMDEDEVLEVIDEEAEIILKLESLFERAKAQLVQTSRSFSSFVSHFISESIVYSHDEKRVDNEYVQRVREIGIWLEYSLEENEKDDNEVDDSEMEIKRNADESNTTEGNGSEMEGNRRELLRYKNNPLSKAKRIAYPIPVQLLRAQHV